MTVLSLCNIIKRLRNHMIVIARINKLVLFVCFIAVSCTLFYLVFLHIGGASIGRSFFYEIMGESVYILMYGSLFIIEYIIVKMYINSNSYIYLDDGVLYFGGKKVGNFHQIEDVIIKKNFGFNASLILWNNKNRKFVIKSILLKEDANNVRSEILDLRSKSVVKSAKTLNSL